MPIKVAHVITRLDLGGAQQNTLFTVRHLDRKLFTPLLISGSGGMLDEETRRDAHVDSIFLESLKRDVSPANDLLAIFELANIFTSHRPEIVHTHSSKAGILGRIAAALAGVPVIVHTYHGFGFHDRQNVVVRTLYSTLERICSHWTDRLIFVSRSNALYAERHGIDPGRAPTIIRSGVDLSSFPASVDAAALKMSIGIGRHKLLVVSIGNLKPQKNAGDFVAAAARVCAANPEARFVFLGDGPQRAALEARAFALGLNDRFFFLGWRRDGAQWLAAADVFAMTSLWEGLPRALVEAMKSGLPSVCYATDGITDLIREGENGYSVAPGSVEELARRIDTLLGDESLRRRMGKAAAASIGEEFEIESMVRRQEALYLSLIDDVSRS